MDTATVIRTPDQRLRVFVSSTLGELAPERAAVREAIERLHLSPVLFELGARPHPPRELYRAYLAQSHIFVGIYWRRYGWVAPGETISGLEDEYQLAAGHPKLLYLKRPAPDREDRLDELIATFQADDHASYRSFSTPEELAALVENDLAVLLSERFEAGAGPQALPPPLRTAPPVPLTETIGRDEEVAAITALLRTGARLVTLTGPGGIGKTRLALEVARRVHDAYPDGVHYLPLASVTDADRVLPTVAERLGARAEGTQRLSEALADRLRGWRALLVLDNVEQVVAAAPDLAALLEHVPGLHLLITSRQALRVRAEREMPVAPLSLPAANLPLEALAGEPAVRLFLDRARAVAPGFQLTQANADAIAELCRRLDGLPLGIELAAARVRLLPPAALLRRLGDRLDLAAAGEDLPERQRTLRATVDWSYQLLEEPERALFARLSVFAGGCSLNAAEVVCGTGGDILEPLASLLDKSLLRVSEDDAVGEPRFQMLETIRAYAAERLHERGETEALQRRHLDWYRRLCDEAQPYLCGPGQREWAARVDPERADLRAAVATALESDDDDAVIELIWDVYVYYWIRDAVDEPEAWMAKVAEAGRPLDDLQRAKLRTLQTLSRIYRGDFDDVEEPLATSLDLFRVHGLDFEAAVALKELAHVHYVVNRDADAAIAALEESSRLFAAVHHDWGVALTETMLGTMLTAVGDLQAGEAHQQRSMQHSRPIDNEPLIAQALLQLALIRFLQDRHDEAVPLLEEAAGHLRRGRYQVDTTACLDALAALALARDRPQVAARAVAVAQVARARLGTALWPSVQRFVDRLTTAVRREVGEEAFAAQVAEAEDLDLFATLDEALSAVRVDDVAAGLRG